PQWNAMAERLRLRNPWPLERGLHLPSVRWSMPRLGNPMPSVSLGSSARGVRASAPDGGAWQILVWLGALVLAGVVLWKLRNARGRDAAAGGVGWRLGPWPVNPSAVRTREELVRAFDYLSLLLLGSDARHWNHRQIADRLGDAPAA